MSDSEDSTVTYTVVSRLFGGSSDIVSLGVDEPPMMPEDPYAYVVAAFQALTSPDYVPGREKPEQAPPLPEFIPEPVYPEFMPPEDEVFLEEEQPLPAAVSPTADLPGYTVDSDPKEDPADYPAKERDDDDGSSNDDDDDGDDVEEDEEEEEEHPALADSPHHHMYTVLLLGFLTESNHLHQFVSPPLHVSSPPLPSSPTYPLGYRAAMIRLRAETPSTSHPLPSASKKVVYCSRSKIVGESSSAVAARLTGGFRVDYGFVATLDDKIRRDPERDVGYEITDMQDVMLVGMPGAPATDEQSWDDRALISGWVNMLYKDIHDHAWTARLMETEARLSCGSISFRDRGVVGGRPQETGIIYQGTKTAEDPTDSDGRVSKTTGSSQRSCTTDAPEEIGSSS
nr:hypothetical protein [Tanacetum cinerariifolium]